MNVPKYAKKICTVVGISSFLAGSYHGFCDSQGIPLGGNLEFILKYGGAMTQGIFMGTVTGREGWRHKGIIFSPQRFEKGKITKEKYEGRADRFNREKDPIPGPTIGFLLGAGVGSITTGIATLVGYGVGYLTGNLTK